MNRPRYLLRKNLVKIRNGIGIRALIKIRCGNMEGDNKFWLEEEKRKCMFCEEREDNIVHLIEKCRVAEEWFGKLRKSKGERIKWLWEDVIDKEKVLKEALKKW